MISILRFFLGVEKPYNSHCFRVKNRPSVEKNIQFPDPQSVEIIEKSVEKCLLHNDNFLQAAAAMSPPPSPIRPAFHLFSSIFLTSPDFCPSPHRNDHWLHASRRTYIVQSAIQFPSSVQSSRACRPPNPGTRSTTSHAPNDFPRKSEYYFAAKNTDVFCQNLPSRG